MRIVAVIAFFAACTKPQPPTGADASASNGVDAARAPIETTDSEFAYKEAYRRVVRKHVNQMKECWDHALEQRSDTRWAATSRPTLSFTIVADGRVRDARVEGVDDPRVAACLSKAIASWRFPVPPSARDYPVRYPFHPYIAGD